jgi:hypothetical protein
MPKVADHDRRVTRLPYIPFFRENSCGTKSANSTGGELPESFREQEKRFDPTKKGQ